MLSWALGSRCRREEVLLVILLVILLVVMGTWAELKEQRNRKIRLRSIFVIGSNSKGRVSSRRMSSPGCRQCDRTKQIDPELTENS